MQQVSEAYKESMIKPFRDRGYIQVSLGIINEDAQTSAAIRGEDEDFAYFSYPQHVFSSGGATLTHATLEEGFSKVDGSMVFLPREGSFYGDTGLISPDLIPTEGAEDAPPYTVNIRFNSLPVGTRLDMKGLTLDFGDNYPTDFEITSANNHVSVTDNTQSQFVTTEVFEDAQWFTITVHRMKNPNTRFRLYSILFGYGVMFENNNVMSSSLDSYVSPISAEVPQIDFSVQIADYENTYDVESEDSAINFLQLGQPMTVRYGYELYDKETDESTIEWLHGAKLLLSDWDKGENSLTLRGTDLFRSMTLEYYMGGSNSYRNYAALAYEVLAHAGVYEDECYIDPSLETIEYMNPMPRVSCKEALQIIANATGCILSQSREGVLQIKPLESLTPSEFIMSRDDMTSTPQARKRELVKEIEVCYYRYLESDSWDYDYTEDVSVQAGELSGHLLDEAIHDCDVALYEKSDVDFEHEIPNAVSVSLGWSSYYIPINFHVSGDYVMKIRAKKYVVKKRSIIHSINEIGSRIVWENPMLHCEEDAQRVAGFLDKYYSANLEYEYDTRGNPELDVCDIISQEKRTGKDKEKEYVDVLVSESTLNFNQSFSGKVTTLTCPNIGG